MVCLAVLCAHHGLEEAAGRDEGLAALDGATRRERRANMALAHSAHAARSPVAGSVGSTERKAPASTKDGAVEDIELPSYCFVTAALRMWTFVLSCATTLLRCAWCAVLRVVLWVLTLPLHSSIAAVVFIFVLNTPFASCMADFDSGAEGSGGGRCSLIHVGICGYFGSGCDRGGAEEQHHH